MSEQEIVKIIESYFKPKDVGVGILNCICSREDVLKMANELYSKLELENIRAYDQGCKKLPKYKHMLVAIDFIDKYEREKIGSIALGLIKKAKK